MIRVLILLILVCPRILMAQPIGYGVVNHAAPVLNTPEFSLVFGGKDGTSLKTDSCGQVRELEFIALPGTVFRLLEKQRLGRSVVYRVETDEYPSVPGVRLYLDSRFVKVQSEVPAPRKPVLPTQEQISAALKKGIGSPYVWGGNLQYGVPELSDWFYGKLAPERAGRLTLAGLDCSGLLYQASGGSTPRNTSQLVNFGSAVAVNGKKTDEILPLLEPFDLLVWKGHVVIVLDRETAIESSLACGQPGNGGVVVTSLPQRLREIMRTRRPADVWPDGKRPKDVFVVRRWYGL